jgi:hypothetical protein
MGWLHFRVPGHVDDPLAVFQDGPGAAFEFERDATV